SLKAFYYSNEYREQLTLNELEFINKIASEIETIEKQIKALQAKNSTQVFDSFATKSIEIISEALAEKDQIIHDLQRQNQDLDYLLTTGKSELRREVSKLQAENKELQQQLAQKEVAHE